MGEGVVLVLGLTPVTCNLTSKVGRVRLDSIWSEEIADNRTIVEFAYIIDHKWSQGALFSFDRKDRDLDNG